MNLLIRQWDGWGKCGSYQVQLRNIFRRIILLNLPRFFIALGFHFAEEVILAEEQTSFAEKLRIIKGEQFYRNYSHDLGFG